VPTPEIVEIASQTAQGMNILPLTPPAPNSSFELQFYGPSVQCSPANDTLNPIFDYYSNSLWKNYGVLTQNTFEQGNISCRDLPDSAIGAPWMLFFSAFAPYAGSRGWLSDLDANLTGHDQFNNWDVDLPPEFYLLNKPWQNETLENITAIQNGTYGRIVQQLWLQTSSERFVCLLGNASYNVNFQFVDGVQSMAQYDTTDFDPLWMPQQLVTTPYDIPPPPASYSYMSVFMAFTSLLSGNVTTNLGNWELDRPTTHYTMDFDDTSSKVLQSGLTACDEFTNSYWNENPVILGTVESGMGPVLWNDFSNFFAEGGPNNRTLTADLFQKPAWMCRNRTLVNAIENLANNITISMLSSPSLT
jgi:hypothetical protein